VDEVRRPDPGGAPAGGATDNANAGEDGGTP